MAFSIVCPLYSLILFSSVKIGFLSQSSSLPCRLYLLTFTMKHQASQDCTTWRLELDSQRRLKLMHDPWIGFIYTLRTRTVALENPSLDCVSKLFSHLFFFCCNQSSTFAASMVPGSILLPIGLLLSGWSAQQHLPWIVTDIVR